MATGLSKNTAVIGLEEGWAIINDKAIKKLQEFIDNGIRKRQKKLFQHNDYMAVYTKCYDMCTQRAPYNWSEALYERHGHCIEEYLQNAVLPAFDKAHNGPLLTELVKRWNNHKIMNDWLEKFFRYLNKYYVKYHSLPLLSKSGKILFKKQVFDIVKDNVVAALLQAIQKERDGEVVQPLKPCIKVFEHMGMGKSSQPILDVYQEDFEKQFLGATKNTYRTKSQLWIASDSTPEYLKKAERVLEEESDRVHKYLHQSTKEKLLDVCQAELLAKHEETLLNKEGSGCRVLLQNEKQDDLQRMFQLFRRLDDGLPPMAKIVKEHIQEMGLAIVSEREAKTKGTKDSSSDPTFVRKLLSLHIKYRALVHKEFAGHSLFQKALKDAFEVFINKDVGKCTNAQMLSTYCDRVLKTGGEKMTDDQIEKNLDDVVQLFSYLTDKDFFVEIYRNQLARRLLNKRSKSDDAEKSMIQKLKLRCGAQFTGPLEGMINDLSVGSESHKEFETAMQKLPEGLPIKGDGNFTVQVLTTGCWPSYQLMDVNMPPQMEKCMQLFQQHYLKRTNHRTLKWVHRLGQATVRGYFGKRWFDLQVTTLQAACLMRFNHAFEFSFEELREALGVSAEVMKRILHSFSRGKTRVLLKKPGSKSIKTTDSFSFNKAFRCRSRTFRIPMASLDSSHDKKRVQEDRSIAIEAAIVRIMKARKTLAHQQLVTEVLAQLAFFKPDPKMVKRRISALIDREYLERDQEQSNIYHYLA